MQLDPISGTNCSFLSQSSKIVGKNFLSLWMHQFPSEHWSDATPSMDGWPLRIPLDVWIRLGETEIYCFYFCKKKKVLIIQNCILVSSDDLAKLHNYRVDIDEFLQCCSGGVRADSWSYFKNLTITIHTARAWHLLFHISRNISRTVWPILKKFSIHMFFTFSDFVKKKVCGKSIFTRNQRSKSKFAQKQN